MNEHPESKASFTDYISFICAYPVIIIFGLLPFELAMFIGYILGTIVYYVFPYRKNVMRENLKRAFGKDISDKEMNRIIKRIWQHTGLCFVEFVKLPYLSKEKIASLVTEIENENYHKQVIEKGGYIAVTGHLGHWEFMGAYFAARGFEMNVLAKFIHNPCFDKFVNDRRRKLGYPPIYIHEGMKQLITILNSGVPVVFVADQDARRNGIFVNYFGEPASTFTGPAFFHVKTKVPILPVFDVRTGLTKHKIIFGKPIYMPEKVKVKEYIIEVTQQYTKMLEDVVRKYPNQYFWFHKRWKTKPKQKQQ